MDRREAGTPQGSNKHMGHPRALFYLFFAEMWERFSFYGMRALLTLYMVEKLFASLAERDALSAIIYGSYGSLVYVTPVVGGRLADNVIGARNGIVLGGILMSLGHFVLAIEHDVTFFLALALLVVGNGFFKPNISTLVGKMYAPGDKKKDAGFMIFYMGINIGAMLAPLVCGFLGERYGWHYGFGMAGVGMLLGLAIFHAGSRQGVFRGEGLPPRPTESKKDFGWVYIGAVLSVPLVALLIFYSKETGGTLVNYVFLAVGVAVAAYVLHILTTVSKVERERLLALVVFIIFMTVFWGFFEMQGSSLTLFAKRNVDLDSVGINASQTNAINPLFIILLALPVSALWVGLSKRKRNPPTPYKFVLGFLLMGIAFYVLHRSRFAADEGVVPFSYLFLAYLLISMGELCMSPIGLSKATDLSPARFASFIMGVWFLSSSYAFLVVSALGKHLSIEDSGQGDSKVRALVTYADGFEQIAYVCLAMTVLVLAVAPLVRRWMHGVH